MKESLEFSCHDVRQAVSLGSPPFLATHPVGGWWVGENLKRFSLLTYTGIFPILRGLRRRRVRFDENKTAIMCRGAWLDLVRQ